jgi:hypothetical protein
MTFFDLTAADTQVSSESSQMGESLAKCGIPTPLRA